PRWINPQDRNASSDRVPDHLRGAARAFRFLSIPDRDENIDVAKHHESGRLIRARPLVALSVELEYGSCAFQQSIEGPTRIRRSETRGIPRRRKRKSRFEEKTGGQSRLGYDAIGALRQSGNHYQFEGTIQDIDAGISRCGFPRGFDERDEYIVDAGADRR